MPEGDTIHKVARLLGPELEGRVLVRAEARHSEAVAGLVGRRVERVWPWGKHLLIDVDDGSSLHVHLGMNGQWRRDPPGHRPRLEVLGLFLETEDVALTCARAPVVERLRTRALGLHPVLRTLGPDLLDPDVDLDAVADRAMAQGGRPFLDVLLDQRVACGVGNVYKNEVLFLERIHPLAPTSGLGRDRVHAAYARAMRLMRANLGPGRRNTTGRVRPALWIYEARLCPACGDRVRQAPLGEPGRPTWWCPACQP